MPDIKEYSTEDGRKYSPLYCVLWTPEQRLEEFKRNGGWYHPKELLLMQAADLPTF